MSQQATKQMGARTLPAWSARCDCRNGHNSSSGRCNVRTSGGPDGVTDPTRNEGEVAICEDCRAGCPVGKGTRQPDDVTPPMWEPKRGETVWVFFFEPGDVAKVQARTFCKAGKLWGTKHFWLVLNPAHASDDSYAVAYKPGKVYRTKEEARAALLAAMDAAIAELAADRERVRVE